MKNVKEIDYKESTPCGGTVRYTINPETDFVVYADFANCERCGLCDKCGWCSMCYIHVARCQQKTGVDWGEQQKRIKDEYYNDLQLRNKRLFQLADAITGDCRKDKYWYDEVIQSILWVLTGEDMPNSIVKL